MRIIEDYIGKQRVRNHFAFLPVTIKGETRWLEKVKYVQEWCYDWEDFAHWKNVTFVTEKNERYYEQFEKAEKKNNRYDGK